MFKDSSFSTITCGSLCPLVEFNVGGGENDPTDPGRDGGCCSGKEDGSWDTDCDGVVWNGCKSGDINIDSTDILLIEVVDVA